MSIHSSPESPKAAAEAVSQPKLATLAVRSGQPRQDAFDAVTTPIACTATYAFSSSAELRDHFEGRIQRDEYGRYGNPTVRAAEKKLAALEGCSGAAAETDAVLFASGMAAITTALFALLKKGDHVVLPGEGYRRTRAFVTDLLARFGVESTIVPAGDAEALAAAIEPRTRIILTESPTNPYLRVVDLPALAALKRQHPRVKLVIDATFATPVNQRPLEQGADLVIHSCTKYLGGHNDLLAGVVCGEASLVSLVRDARDVIGAVLDPHAAYLLLRGLKTLPLRVERQNATALGVARWLEAQPEVERVFYPGLESHPDHAVAKKLMTGAGGVVSFVLRADLDTTARALDACRLATIAPSLGGVETLIEQVALMSYYGLSKQEREAIGIADGLVRLSVGLEDSSDIREDLVRVLEVVRRSAGPRVAERVGEDKPGASRSNPAITDIRDAL
ncbi:MAG TPA: aminotransferase class I/II-fold pyridoxal phosphate-dependent enzyme [Labilithrix sp.]|nr:aminotransferase class I/II-fold pyridoxal phosphate-dependent enzyme [Labilithrix sp.]